MLKNVVQGDLRGHGRRKDFSGGTRGFFKHFSRGGQKWQNLFFPTRN